MKKNKKFIIFIIIFIFITVGFTVAYFVYGNTLINIDNEKSISDYLAVDKSNPIRILEMKEYEDYVGILYIDPSDKNEDDDYAHFVALIKHKFYQNRYIKKGSNYGNFTQVSCYRIPDVNSENAVYFIFDISRNETKCTVFEEDMTLNILKKLDEFDVPQTPYILIKEYKLENEYNDISVYNGSITLDDLTEE